MKTTKYSLLLLLSLLVMSCTLKKYEETMRPEGYKIIDQKDVFGRNIRKFVLPNTLKVVLIEEKDSQFSAGALSFDVGADQDPKEHQGLAHFLEHMVFISSQNYPEVDSFQKFVKAQGGMTNAFTANDKTVFFYTVNNEACIESINRFGDLFTHPLLQEQFAEKEVQAVDSESKKNLENDSWREWQLVGLMSSKNHPWQLYSTGNTDTLKDANASVVGEFMNTYYSADGSHLVIFSNQSLDTMEKNVARVFGELENKKRSMTPITAPFIQNKKTPLVEMVPIKDLEEISLYFQTPAQKKFYQAKIPRLVSYFIGHEGMGSLFSYLQKQGLATKLTAGLSENYKAFSLFEIQLQLTKHGLQNYEKVIEEVFSFINLLKTKGMEKFHWDDLAKLARIDFENQEKGSPVSEILRYIGALEEYPLATCEEDSFLIKDYNPQLFNEFVQALTPDNLIVTLKSRTVQPTKTEAIYGTKYNVRSLDEKLLTKINAQKFSHNYQLPEKNNFIPEDFSLISSKKDEKPQLIVNNEWGKAWLQKDTLFKKPRAAIAFNIYTTKGIQSAREVIVSQLSLRSLHYLLTEYLYPIAMAGVSISIEPCSYDQCFSIRLDGYSDKILMVLESILMRLHTDALDRNAFTHILETYQKEKKNEVYNDAYRQVLVMPELFFIRKTYALDELLKEVETVSYDEVMAFSRDVLSHLYIQSTYFGNLTEEKIKRSFNTIIATFEKEYAAKPNAHSTIYGAEFLNYHEKKSFVYNLPRPVNNSANLNVLYYPVKNPEIRAAFRVFSSWMQPEYFTELRTKKQLGYVAAANVRLFNDEIPYFIFLLQSGEYTRARLNNESYQFIETMLDGFTKLDDAKIEELKRGVISQLLESPKTLDDANSRLWLRAFKLNEQFDYPKQEAERVEGLKKENIIAAVSKALNKEDSGAFITFQIQGTFDTELLSKDFTPIEDISTFKKTFGK